MKNISKQIKLLRNKTKLSQPELAQLLGTSLVGIERWERGDGVPSVEQTKHIEELVDQSNQGKYITNSSVILQNGSFASRGSTRRALKENDLLSINSKIKKSEKPLNPILSRIKTRNFFGDGEKTLTFLLSKSNKPALTIQHAATGGTSAGKNTYTYDAHTYHTKVPPQGIVEFIHHYLPKGGLIFDPFAGSGMTGVAALAVGCDVILNELSPAACFISYNFTEKVSTTSFVATIKSILNDLQYLRKSLYTTICRECGKETEILYTIWSYYVLCPCCEKEFRLWDHCRKYGKTVKEHKILQEFNCPFCGKNLKKRQLKRTKTEPVLLGYKCCKTTQVEHELSHKDIEIIELSKLLAEGFYPTIQLSDGVNLNQPKRHGLNTIDQFYTKRNLSAMSHIWREIHKIEDTKLASFAAFVFTSLYQRVTRLSEFRFWGGSGNTARFNVPYIFNEANVFVTFERKASSILDHLETTASRYSGNKVVACNSATNLDYLPDNSIDFIFTDPPFGANINYSEMNIIWESWLDEFTNTHEEAIINRTQGKDIKQYEELMTRSLSECYRVLKLGHWMLLVFMNSSASVWTSLKSAIYRAGFTAERIDIFDKQHGTFKQFVSENTAGFDLVIHCKKPFIKLNKNEREESLCTSESIKLFLENRSGSIPITTYLHVSRENELDFRMLYSEWIAFGLLRDHHLTNFAIFREKVMELLKIENCSYEKKS